MQTYEFPQSDFFGEVFAIVKTINGTYVCPGWHPVPEGTTREQIKFSPSVTKKKAKELASEPEMKRYEASVAGSKPGKFYTVVFEHNRWTCTCPASTFQRGDCKHIKSEQKKLQNI